MVQVDHQCTLYFYPALQHQYEGAFEVSLRQLGKEMQVTWSACGVRHVKPPAIVGWDIWFCPLMTKPLLRTAPRVIRSSVEMTGITELPCGMRATLEKRKIAASKLWKKVLAPAKKKLPASVPMNISFVFKNAPTSSTDILTSPLGGDVSAGLNHSRFSPQCH